MYLGETGGRAGGLCNDGRENEKSVPFIKSLPIATGVQPIALIMLSDHALSMPVGRYDLVSRYVTCIKIWCS